MSRKITVFISAITLFLLVSCAFPPLTPLQNTPEPEQATVTPAGTPQQAGDLPTETAAAIPEATPTAPATATVEAATETPTGVQDGGEAATSPDAQNVGGEAAAANIRYVLQPGSPTTLPNFAHPDLACNWIGVGGQVFALDGNPVKQLVVEVGGSLNKQAVNGLSLTGSAQQWGPGGFEFKLADAPVDSVDTVWIQIYDLNGEQVSEQIFFRTYNDCERNAILFNFAEVTPANPSTIYFPWILNRQITR